MPGRMQFGIQQLPIHHSLDRLEPSPLRVRRRNDDRAEAGRLCGAEGSGQGMHCGAGGADVINDDHVFTVNRGWTDQAEGVAKVFGPLRRRVQMGLRLGVTKAQDGVHDAQALVVAPESARDDIRLVEASGDLSQWMQRHGQQDAALVQDRLHTLLLYQAVSQELR